MKNSKRFLALALTVVMMLSVFAIGASATNNDDTPFTNFSINWIGYQELTARDKEDSSPVYLCYTQGKRTTVKVRAIGCNDNDDDENLTLSNNQLADFVTCAKNVQYKIHTLIYEEGYTQAKLAFKSPNVLGDSITGVWSPDSVYYDNYTSAT